MTILSARVMRASRHYICDDCKTHIITNSQYLRLYGFAEYGDPLTTYRFHLKCVVGLNIKEKIEDEFKRIGIKYKNDEYGHLESVGDDMKSRKTKEPTPFDINNPEDIKRLHEELLDYMKISVMDGTDLTGRRYALEALKKLVERDK